MKICKASKKNMPDIIKVINTAFKPERDYDFDIKEVQPKVYKTNNSKSCKHTIIKENNKIICVGGNLSSQVVIDNKSYSFSIIGSIATLPDYQKQGYFKQLVNSMLQDNIKNKVVFSMLTGLRHRYNFFGFEKCGFRYYFDIDKNFCKYHKPTDDLQILDYEKSMLNDIYKIFQNKQNYILRKKTNFDLTLQTSYSNIYIFKLKENIIGYATFTPIKNRVNELCINDLSFLPDCIGLLFKKFAKQKITIVVSPFDKELVLELDKYAEDKISTEQLHFKVYDMIKFLDMVLRLNKKVKHLPQLKKVINIDNKNILIDTTKDDIKVSYTSLKATSKFTQQQFLRYAFGLISVYDGDELFPLLLDFNYADLF